MRDELSIIQVRNSIRIKLYLIGHAVLSVLVFSVVSKAVSWVALLPACIVAGLTIADQLTERAISSRFVALALLSFSWVAVAHFVPLVVPHDASLGFAVVLCSVTCLPFLIPEMQVHRRLVAAGLALPLFAYQHALRYPFDQMLGVLASLGWIVLICLIVGWTLYQKESEQQRVRQVQLVV